MILTENELFVQFVLLSGSKIYFFWQKYTSQTKCFFGSLSNWSLWCLEIKWNPNCCNQGRLAVIVCRIFKNNVYRVPWAGQWAWDLFNLSSEDVSKDCRMFNGNVVFRCEEIIWHFKSNSTVTVIIIMIDSMWSLPQKSNVIVLSAPARKQFDVHWQICGLLW